MLAQIYMLTGNHDTAIDRLEEALAVPSDLTIPILRIDPLYDPLRGHPRFEALVAWAAKR